MPHPGHERAELVHLCTAIIRIEPSLNRADSAIHADSALSGLAKYALFRRWQRSRAWIVLLSALQALVDALGDRVGCLGGLHHRGRTSTLLAGGKGGMMSGDSGGSVR